MKNLLIILFVLIGGAVMAQTQPSYLGGPSTRVIARGSIEVDSVFGNAVRDTTFTPKRVGYQVYRSADSSLYVAISTSAAQKWMRVGNGGSNSADSSVFATKAWVTTQLAGKQNTLTTGTALQYFKGDLTLGTFNSDVAAYGDANYSAIGHSHNGLIPIGGTAGQIIRKISSTNYDYGWFDDTSGSTGSGDMLKTIYDANANSSVDNSEQLGGQLPSYYTTLYKGDGTITGARTVSLGTQSLTIQQDATHRMQFLPSQFAGLYDNGTRTSEFSLAHTGFIVQNYATSGFGANSYVWVKDSLMLKGGNNSIGGQSLIVLRHNYARFISDSGNYYFDNLAAGASTDSMVVWNPATKRFGYKTPPTGSGGGTPGGSTQQVQVNIGGAFAGNNKWTRDTTNNSWAMNGSTANPYPYTIYKNVTTGDTMALHTVGVNDGTHYFDYNPSGAFTIRSRIGGGTATPQFTVSGSSGAVSARGAISWQYNSGFGGSILGQLGATSVSTDSYGTIQFGSSANAYLGNIYTDVLTANRIYKTPNRSGTIALREDITDSLNTYRASDSLYFDSTYFEGPGTLASPVTLKAGAGGSGYALTGNTLGSEGKFGSLDAEGVSFVTNNVERMGIGINTGPGGLRTISFGNNGRNDPSPNNSTMVMYDNFTYDASVLNQDLVAFGAYQGVTKTVDGTGSIFGFTPEIRWNAATTHGVGGYYGVQVIRASMFAASGSTGNVNKAFPIIATSHLEGMTVDSLAKVYIEDSYRPGGGTVANNIGLFVQAQRGGGTANFNIYSQGSGTTGPNYFGGPIVGGSILRLDLLAGVGTRGLAVNSDGEVVVSGTGGGTLQDVTDAGNTTDNYIDFTAASYSQPTTFGDAGFVDLAARFLQNSGAGMVIQAFSNAGTKPAVRMQGHVGGTTTSQAALIFEAYKNNGGTGRTQIAAGEKVASFWNGAYTGETGSLTMAIYGNGQVTVPYYAGTGTRGLGVTSDGTLTVYNETGGGSDVFTKTLATDGSDNNVQVTTTSAGSTASVYQVGLFAQMLPGYTGNGATISGQFNNTSAGVGTDPFTNDFANFSMYGTTAATTTGTNVGIKYDARGGLVNIGVLGMAKTNKNSGTNYGVIGLAQNGGTSGEATGGYFGLGTTAPLVSTAALFADNGSVSAAIFRALDNGSSVFAVLDGGIVQYYNTSAPGTPSGSAYQYAVSGEMIVKDASGNATTISPHNFSGIPQGKSEEMAWAFYSERDGKYINVDMLKLARAIEKLTGEKLVYIGDKK